MPTYSEQLRDPRWQRKRLELLEAAGWMCNQCFSGEKELHVHHYWYEPRTAPWDYPDDCYGVLCDPCHKDWHTAKLHCDKSLAGLSITQLTQVSGLIAGLKCVSECVDYEMGRHCDALFVCGFVRGFWPPHEYQNAIADECLLRVSRKQAFWFSSVVERVIPDRAEFAYVRCWLESLRMEREEVL